MWLIEAYSINIDTHSTSNVWWQEATFREFRHCPVLQTFAVDWIQTERLTRFCILQPPIVGKLFWEGGQIQVHSVLGVQSDRGWMAPEMTIQERAVDQ